MVAFGGQQLGSPLPHSSPTASKQGHTHLRAAGAAILPISLFFLMELVSRAHNLRMSFTFLVAVQTSQCWRRLPLTGASMLQTMAKVN